MVAARYFGSCELGSTKLGNGWKLCQDQYGEFARRTIKDKGIWDWYDMKWIDPPAIVISVVCLDVGQDLTPREYRHDGLVIGHRRSAVDNRPFPLRNLDGQFRYYGPIPEKIIEHLGRAQAVA